MITFKQSDGCRERYIACYRSPRLITLQIIRRWKKLHVDTLRILELRTNSNAILDPGDQIFEVLGDDDIVVGRLFASLELRSNANSGGGPEG